MRKYLLILGTAAEVLALAVGAAAGTNESASATKTRTESSSETAARRFTLDRAILTALQQNPDILRAKQEIERSKGVIIQVRAAALPRIAPSGSFQWTDPQLNAGGSGGSFSTGGVSGGAASDLLYSIRVTGTQLVFSYSTLRSIRGTFFQRDSAYFAFRNTLDQVIATVKTQFYQVVVNKALIGVQEEQVQLLQSQLKDQQNRFEAGTVPRFNVLQAEVALYNQIPQLITARNNFRISQLTLAKTLGLDFDPLRGEKPPLEVVGEMPYNPRDISLVNAIELGKQRRPFLKQARANVLNQIEQVHVALGGFLPTINAIGGGEWVSSPINPGFFNNISKGWLAQ